MANIEIKTPDTDTDPSKDTKDLHEMSKILDLRESKQVAPETVHPDQVGLGEFEDATQTDVHPDAIDTDPRLEHLPAFLPDDSAAIYDPHDPSLHSGHETCDRCGVDNPWLEPLERGVEGVRPGGPREGDPEFDFDDPSGRDMKRDPETGCPFCNSKSISFRKTKTPDFRCNNCGTEFNYPVKREHDDDPDRVRLFWKCRECGRATQAPFKEIPEELIPDDW